MAGHQQIDAMTAAVTNLTERLEQQNQTLTNLQSQNVELANRVQIRDNEFEQQSRVLTTIQSQNVELANRVQTRDTEMEELIRAVRRQSPASVAPEGSGNRNDSIVQKEGPGCMRR